MEWYIIMAGDEKPKNRWRMLAGIAGSIISLAVLTYIAIALISGNGLNMSWFTGMFSKRAPVEYANEYHFDVGRDRVFTSLGDSLAAAGTLGIQVLDAGGAETLKVPFRMSVPAIYAQGSQAIAFDIGGTALRVFDDASIITSVESNSAIIAASINKNGWFCVCVQEGGGYKGAVTVYNSKGSEVYRARLVSGYVLSAVLSPDNKSLAVLNLTDEGSRITFYSLNSETPERMFDLPGGLIIDIRYMPGNSLLVVSTDSLILLDKNGTDKELFNYSGGLLGKYTTGGGLIALHILDYGVGYSGRLVALGEDGKLLGEIDTDREIVSMSACGEFLAVLRSDGLFLYDPRLDSLPPSKGSGSTAGAAYVLALEGGAVLAAGDNSAVVMRVES